MKDIIGFEGIYSITEDGKVWSYKRKKFLSQSFNNMGYKLVCLSKYGKHKNYAVHRLVAQAYLPNPHNYSDVNHKDENPANNHVDNLEWCSHKYNMNYGTCSQRRAEKTRKKIHCIELNRTFDSISQAATAMDIHKGNLGQCCKGNLKTAGGYHWKYV